MTCHSLFLTYISLLLCWGLFHIHMCYPLNLSCRIGWHCRGHTVNNIICLRKRLWYNNNINTSPRWHGIVTFTNSYMYVDELLIHLHSEVILVLCVDQSLVVAGLLLKAAKSWAAHSFSCKLWWTTSNLPNTIFKSKFKGLKCTMH